MGFSIMAVWYVKILANIYVAGEYNQLIKMLYLK